MGVLLLCYAGLRPEVAKRIGTAAPREELGCRSYRRASWEAPLGRVREEVCSPDKTLLREEATERRGTSAKRPLSKDVAHSSIQLFIYPSSHSFIH